MYPFTVQTKVAVSLLVITQELLGGLWFDGEFYEKLGGHLVFIYIRQFLTTILHHLLVDVPSA